MTRAGPLFARTSQKQPVGQISVQPLAQKYSAFVVGQITDLTPRVPPHYRGVSRSSRTRGGMRWTRQRFARDGIAGRDGERPVSDHQASGREMQLAYGEVVWSGRPDAGVKSCGVKSAQPGLDKTYPQATVAKEPGHRRARRKPLKPLRAGTPGDSGVLVVTRVLSTTTSAHEAAGATGIRRSPRP